MFRSFGRVKMADFDARVAFEDILTEIESELGGLIKDGAPNLENATDGLLHQISEKIGHNIDKAEEVAKLKQLALKIISQYVEKSGKGVNALDNISNSQLKEIFPKAEDIALDKEDLKEKILEVAGHKIPERAKIVEIVEDKAKQDAFQALTDKKAKIDFVSKEFESGVFSSSVHQDFFLEQYGKGVVNLVSELESEKMDYILRQDEINRRKDISKNTKLKYFGLDINEEKDLGLERAIKGFNNAKEKGNLDDMLVELEREAVRMKYDGYTDYETVKKARAELADSKWYRLRRNLKLRGAIRKIEKGKPIKANNRRFKKFSERFDAVVELQSQYASVDWFGANGDFKKKFVNGFKLVFRRSPEKLMNKLLANANQENMQKYMKDFEQRKDSLGNLSKRMEVDARIKSQLEAIYGKAYDQLKGVNDRLILNKETALKDFDIKNEGSGSIRMNRFLSNLQSRADKLNKLYNKDLEDNPTYLACKRKYGEKRANEMFHVEFSKYDVLSRIAESYGYENVDKFLEAKGIQGEELKEFKKAILKEPEKKVEEPKTEEQVVEEEVVKTQREQADMGKQDENSVSLELNEENNVKLAKILEKSGWSKESDGGKYTRKNDDGKKETIDFLYNPDNKKYSMRTLDENGAERKATAEDYKALAAAMKTNGTTSVKITDLKDEDLEMALKAMEDAGITVSNKEDVQKRIAEAEKAQAEQKSQAEKEQGASENDVETTATIIGDNEEKDKNDKGNEVPPVTTTEKGSADDENSGFKSIEDVRASVYADTTLTEEQKSARLSIIQNIDRGNHVEIGDIKDTFGKDSKEFGYLGNISAANDLRGNIENKEELEVLDELKAETKIQGKDHLDNRFTEVRKVVHSFTDNKVNEDDAAYKSLSEAEKGYVKALCKARFGAKPKKGETQEEAMNRAEKDKFVKLRRKAMIKKSPSAREGGSRDNSRTSTRGNTPSVKDRTNNR